MLNNSEEHTLLFSVSTLKIIDFWQQAEFKKMPLTDFSESLAKADNSYSSENSNLPEATFDVISKMTQQYLTAISTM